MASAKVSQYLVEALVPAPTPSPTTPTGAGISQCVVEVLGAFTSGVRVSQYILEVLVSDGDTGTPQQQRRVPRATYLIGV